MIDTLVAIVPGWIALAVLGWMAIDRRRRWRAFDARTARIACWHVLQQ
jgi:hypothetical protein